MIDKLVEKAKIASEEYMDLTQEQVDNIVKHMSMAGLEHHMELAKMAVEETGMGVLEDKVIKNHYAAEYVYNKYKYEKTCGVIEQDENYGIKKIAEPVGVIAAVLIGAVIGIKLMVSGIEGKVEAKQLLVPYVVGCVMIFCGFGIWKLIVTILQNV